MTLLPRHGKTHLANIPYGYYTAAVSLIFIILLIGARKLIPVRQRNRSKWAKWALSSARGGSPLLYLVVLFVALLVPFVHHYSLLGYVGLYLKRLGRLSYVLATLNLFLTLRPNFLLPGYVYLDLIPLHKWLSRSLCLLALVHGVGFLVKWALDSQVSFVAKAFYNIPNLAGLVVGALMAFMVLLSVRPVRRFSYRSFYLTHIIGAWVFVFLTAYHARPGVFVPYTLLNAGLFVFYILSKTVPARGVELVSKSTDDVNNCLTRIVLPRKAMPEHFAPGSHLRISPYRRVNPLYYMLPSHPYTVASMPEDKDVELIVREHASGFHLLTGLGYTIQNHYESVPRQCLQSATRIALVCGGSGLSYALPIFRHFASEEKADQVKYLRLIWLVRDKYDVNVLGNIRSLASSVAQFDIFVTRSVPPDDTVESGSKLSPAQQQSPITDDLEFELESFGDQLDQNGALITPEIPNLPSGLASSFHFGRKLDWMTDLAQFVERDDLGSTWLVACGPKGLNDAAKLYAQQNEINLASETYAL